MCVAPSSRASSNRLGCASTATIVTAPTARAAMTAARPTLPVPKTATVSPSVTASAVMIEPAPVCTLQPSGPSRCRGSVGSTVTALRGLASACVANDDCPNQRAATGSPCASVAGARPLVAWPPMLRRQNVRQ